MYQNGLYIKFYEYYYLMEFTDKEWKLISKDVEDCEVKMSDVVNFFYKYIAVEVEE